MRLRWLKHFAVVREAGLEPARRKTLEPKSSASTNSATRAGLNILTHPSPSLPIRSITLTDFPA